MRSLGSFGHPGDERWALFARGVLEDPERAVMEDHVSSGCLKCLSTLSAARRAVDVKGRAGAGSRVRQPLPVPSSGGSEWLASLSRPARLVFDNVEVPLPPESDR